jgi:hypothetical protein
MQERAERYHVREPVVASHTRHPRPRSMTRADAGPGPPKRYRRVPWEIDRT